MIYRAVSWAATRLDDDCASSQVEKKQQARRTGVCGKVYVYWYLRRHGYVFVARNHAPRSGKGQLDLVGDDGPTLAFVEVRTRTMREELSALPELSITPDPWSTS